jgi:O-methyltransferase involved in polyketide biosynthesis
VLQELLRPTPITDSAFPPSSAQSETAPPPPAAISQLVILGAGFDTRALRFHPQLSAHNVSVFEIDLPALQHRKQQTLAQASEAAGHSEELQQAVDRIRFIPLNLTEAAAGDGMQSGSERPSPSTQLPSLWSALASAGYSSSAPSLFIVEGLTAYLPEQTVTDTLHSLHQHSSPDSVLVMDFFAADPPCRAGDEYAAVRQQVGEVGEPILFDMDVRELEGGQREGETEEERAVRWNRQHRQEVRDWLGSNGWHLLQHAGPEELTARYIDDESEQDKRVSCFEHVVVAKNQPQHETVIEAV